MELEGWEAGENLGRDKGEETTIRMYCMKNNHYLMQGK